jgi:hypothetical protein
MGVTATYVFTTERLSLDSRWLTAISQASDSTPTQPSIKQLHHFERDQKLRAAYKLENHAQNQVDKAKENLKDAQYRLFNEGDDNKDLSVCDAVTAATRDVLAAR